MYKPKTFDIPALTGISQQTTNEHLKLYAGYVKNVNLIHEQIAQLKQDGEQNAYAIAEMQRRLGFEFGGMKNHEAYFAQFEGGAQAIPNSPFKTLVDEQFGSFEVFVAHVKTIAGTRGVGWAMVYIDRTINKLICTWVDEQQIGQLADVDIVLGLDMWEHSYMLDHPPSEKKEYIESFFKNISWEVVANRV